MNDNWCTPSKGSMGNFSIKKQGRGLRNGCFLLALARRETLKQGGARA